MKKNGFTVLEILIALTILVIIFSLITLMYVRAARTRNIINAYNEIGEVLSQMVDTIGNGRKGVFGLKDAGNLCSHQGGTTPITDSYPLNKYTLVFSDFTAQNTVIYQITANNITDTSLYQTTTSGTIDLNPNKKIYLVSGSGFEFYDANGKNIISEKLNTETTLVKIVLIGKSTNPAMKKMVPMRIETQVRLKNTLSF
ncbi:MAG: PulJ/GspJ family protein [Candidatus Ratteibacteria bacterium]